MTFSLDTDVTGAVIAAESEHVAHNYHPLPVVVSRGEGSWVTDVEGKRYLDLLSAYSALNFGHRHPALLAAVNEQLGRITLTSRAYHNDRPVVSIGSAGALGLRNATRRCRATARTSSAFRGIYNTNQPSDTAARPSAISVA